MFAAMRRLGMLTELKTDMMSFAGDLYLRALKQDFACGVIQDIRFNFLNFL